MGCLASSQRVDVTTMTMAQSSSKNVHGKETILAALARLDQDIANTERFYPEQRLAIVSAELESIQREIKEFEEISNPIVNSESYSKTMHQIFINLDLYRRPLLATENEDFIANVNRKEMRRIELLWLQMREKELQKEERLLHAQIFRIRSLYIQLKQLLGFIWKDEERPGMPLEKEYERAHSLRDALAIISIRLKSAVEYTHSALRLLDEALPAWKLASIGKSGWERTAACAQTCRLLVHARCQERGARRALSALAAPRAARALRLTLDYAFTDAIHDHKYLRATEIYLQFKETLILLLNSIHEVLLNNNENLGEAEKELTEARRKLRATRANDVVRKGVADVCYDPTTFTNVKASVKNI